MAGMLEFDADAASRVEAAYTTPDITHQRAAVVAALGLKPGERVIVNGLQLVRPGITVEPNLVDMPTSKTRTTNGKVAVEKAAPKS